MQTEVELERSPIRKCHGDVFRQRISDCPGVVFKRLLVLNARDSKPIGKTLCFETNFAERNVFTGFISHAKQS